LHTMRIGVLTETDPGERRVSLPPDSVAALVASGHTCRVQAGAGQRANGPDAAYTAAGATLAGSPAEVVEGCDVLATVNAPAPGTVALLAPGATVLGLLAPFQNAERVAALRDHGVIAYALELIPRISRAQAMDALSSQALVAGYRAALAGAELLPRFFPLFMTAAGTIPPARVLVLGAGVAGLQAIATARRLGAVVSGYDVRAAAADEVRSLGARFVDLKLETQEGTGGYAAAQSEDFAVRQRAALAAYVADADVVITTAAIPGRRAPLLVTAEMAEAMRPGSVIVDLATDPRNPELGGNCELARPGETLEHRGVRIWGGRDVPSQLPEHASRLYGANVRAMIDLLAAGDAGDEILVGSRITQGGRIVHDAVRRALEPEGDS
jgi:NAD(P) transhydrogenase subunit alpha